MAKVKDSITIYAFSSEDRCATFQCRCGKVIGYAERDGWGYWANGKQVCSWTCQRRYEKNLSTKYKFCGGDITAVDACRLWRGANVTDATEALALMKNEFGDERIDRLVEKVGWNPAITGYGDSTLLALITPPTMRDDAQGLLVENYRKAIKRYERKYRKAASAVG